MNAFEIQGYPRRAKGPTVSKGQPEAVPGAFISNATGRPCRRIPANYHAFPVIGMDGVIGPAAPGRRI